MNKTTLARKLDGGQHFEAKSDRIRDEWLEKEGFRILRFWDNEVFENPESIIEKILNHCK